MRKLNQSPTWEGPDRLCNQKNDARTGKTQRRGRDPCGHLYKSASRHDAEQGITGETYMRSKSVGLRGAPNPSLLRPPAQVPQRLNAKHCKFLAVVSGSSSTVVKCKTLPVPCRRLWEARPRLLSSPSNSNLGGDLETRAVQQILRAEGLLPAALQDPAERKQKGLLACARTRRCWPYLHSLAAAPARCLSTAVLLGHLREGPAAGSTRRRRGQMASEAAPPQAPARRASAEEVGQAERRRLRRCPAHLRRQ